MLFLHDNLNELLTALGFVATGLTILLLRRRWPPGNLVGRVASFIQWLCLLAAALAALQAATGWPVGHLVVAIHGALSQPIFTLGDKPISVLTFGTVVLIVFVSWWASNLARTGIEGMLNRRGIGEPGSISAVARLCQYVLLAIGVAVGVSTLGVDLSAVFAAGAVFAVGFGLAMQQVAENFVSGIILLVERTIRPGDVLEVEGEMVRVQHLGIRATLVRSLDDEEIIVPNSILVQNKVKNLRLTDSLMRIRCLVGVAYDSDLKKTHEALTKAASTFPSVEGRPPVINLQGFGSSSVDFEVSVWIDDPWSKQRARTRIAFAIWDALKEANVVIAFPQLDLHLDPAVLQAMARQGDQKPKVS